MHVARRLPAPVLLDGLLALGVGVVLLGSAHWIGFSQVPPQRPVDPLAYALLIVAAGSLVGRRTWPLPVLVGTVAATLAYLLAGYPYGPIFVAPMLAMYSVAAAEPVRRSLAACGLATLALFMHAVPAVRDPLTLAQDLPWPVGMMLAPWALGAVLRLQRASRRREQEDEAQRRSYEQRLQVAREVHDIVGHGLAVINMQAGVALHVLEKRPDQARVALDAIKQTSKEALDELRQTLAVFRQAVEPNGSRRPLPGLEQLDGLVKAMGESGLDVELRVSGRRATVPAAVDMAAYRIVQESLTNVLRHAGTAVATVHVHHDRSHIDLEVTDNGRARVTDTRRPGGHGIAGMRERAVAIGGELAAEPRAEGGFRVRARLPTGGQPV